MGQLLDCPKTDKKSESGEGLGIKYGLSSMQGWRVEMEDSHCAKIGLPFGLDKWSFFAVFDGHAGQKASEYCAFNLLDTILIQDGTSEQFMMHNRISPSEDSNIDATKDSVESENKAPNIVPDNNEAHDVKQQPDQTCDLETKNEQKKNSEHDTQNIPQNSNDLSNEVGSDKLQCTVENEDNKNQQTTDRKTGKEVNDKVTECVAARKERYQLADQLDKIKEAIRTGFLYLDEKLRGLEGEDKSGTTAVCSLISPTHYFFANCGDSRAVLSYRGKADFSTEDHKPINPKEKERIQNAGGSVMIQRVNGSLAVSRALGDFDYKQNSGKGPCEQLVSPEPEIHYIRRTDDDEFLILACDGIWDVLSNDEICTLVRYLLKIDDDLESICSSVLDVCLNRGSRDNMSMILVVFKGAPTKNPQALNQDREDIEFMKEHVFKFIKNYKHPISSSLFLHTSELITYLNETFELHGRFIPPGPGVESKLELLKFWLEDFRKATIYDD